MNTIIEDQLRLCPQLPTLTGVAVQLVSVARDPNIELADISRLIASDPALTTKMLRVANSSLYQRFRQVQTLEQAVRVLGLNATLTLSLNFSLAACVRSYRAPGIDLDHFWRRALISALAARLLGQHCHLSTLDELFLAALVQDIGRLALDAALPGQYAVTQDIDCDLDTRIVHERRALGTDHVEAGAWLVQSWQLPDYLPLAIWASHDRSRRGGKPELNTFIGCVATSGRIADIVLAPDSEAATIVAQQVAAACLNLSPQTLGHLLDQLVDSSAEVEALFETTLTSPVQADGLRQTAQELITCHKLRWLEAATGPSVRENEFKQIADQLYDVAHRDALTGVFNRRHFDEALDSAFAEAGGNRQPLSLAYLDLDHFKAINDEHGHMAGDTVLKAVADAIQRVLRPNDLLARYGGEEFVVLLPGLDETAAYTIIERVRAGIEALAPRTHADIPVPCTLSAGVATYRDGGDDPPTPTDLLKAADTALYTAKHQGRNRVVQGDTCD